MLANDLIPTRASKMYGPDIDNGAAQTGLTDDLSIQTIHQPTPDAIAPKNKRKP